MRVEILLEQIQIDFVCLKRDTLHTEVIQLNKIIAKRFFDEVEFLQKAHGELILFEIVYYHGVTPKVVFLRSGLSI